MLKRFDGEQSYCNNISLQNVVSMLNIIMLEQVFLDAMVIIAFESYFCNKALAMQFSNVCDSFIA